MTLFAALAAASLALGASAHGAACSAARLSTALPAQSLPARVASVRRRIVAAAVACDYRALDRIAHERDGFTFGYGPETSAVAYWKRQEARGDRPLAKLVKILTLEVTRNEAGAYAWPSAYTEHPKAKDWNALVRAGVYTRAQVERMRKGGNVYYGYRVGITKSGDWQFFVSGD
jgi:hypothetical protein